MHDWFKDTSDWVKARVGGWVGYRLDETTTKEISIRVMLSMGRCARARGIVETADDGRTMVLDEKIGCQDLYPIGWVVVTSP